MSNDPKIIRIFHPFVDCKRKQVHCGMLLLLINVFFFEFDLYLKTSLLLHLTNIYRFGGLPKKELQKFENLANINYDKCSAWPRFSQMKRKKYEKNIQNKYIQNVSATQQMII